MDERTREALEGSIKKWEGIVAGTIPDEGTANCPLCHLFNHSLSEDFCVGCPVYQKTGIRGCNGTPYDEFAENIRADGFARTKAAKRLAQKELDFLISLRPVSA